MPRRQRRSVPIHGLLSLAVLWRATARPHSRQLLQGGTDVCAWADGAANPCILNSAAVQQLSAFPERESFEDAFYACFDRERPVAPCADSAATPAPGPGLASGLVRPLGMGVAPQTDYSQPGPCPYEGVNNPITSGDLPDTFEHNSFPDYVPFKPRTVFFDNGVTCDPTVDPATLHAAGQVLIKHDDGACSACPEAVCSLWQPDPKGYYIEPCTGRLQLGSDARFEFAFPMPGNEAEVDSGPDPWPHLHIRCEGCGASIFNKWYPRHASVETFTKGTYCGVSGESPSILMAEPDASNDIPAVLAEEPAGAPFYIIMQKNWRMPSAREHDAPCWALQHLKSCPDWEAAKTCVQRSQPLQEPAAVMNQPPARDAGAPLFDTERFVGPPVEFCAYQGFTYDDPAYKHGNGGKTVLAQSAAACATQCNLNALCSAATFAQGAPPAESCTFHSATDGYAAGIAVPATAAAGQTLIVARPCAAVQFAGQPASPEATTWLAGNPNPLQQAQQLAQQQQPPPPPPQMPVTAPAPAPASASESGGAEIFADVNGASTPFCVLPGRDYQLPDMDATEAETDVQTLEACAQTCADRPMCAAAVFLQYSLSAAATQDRCYMKAAASVQVGEELVEPSVADPDAPARSLLVRGACGGLQFAMAGADAPAAARRRLQQDGATCETLGRPGNQICVASGTFLRAPEDNPQLLLDAAKLGSEALQSDCPLYAIGAAPPECFVRWSYFFRAIGCAGCVIALDELEVSNTVCKNAQSRAACEVDASAQLRQRAADGGLSLAWDELPVNNAAGEAAVAARGSSSGSIDSGSKFDGSDVLWLALGALAGILVATAVAVLRKRSRGKNAAPRPNDRSSPIAAYDGSSHSKQRFFNTGRLGSSMPLGASDPIAEQPGEERAAAEAGPGGSVSFGYSNPTFRDGSEPPFQHSNQMFGA